MANHLHQSRLRTKLRDSDRGAQYIIISREYLRLVYKRILQYTLVVLFFCLVAVAHDMWQEAPPEIIRHIARFMPLKDVFIAQEVCVNWNAILDDQNAWKEYGRRFPGFDRVEEEALAKTSPHIPIDYKKLFQSLRMPRFTLLYKADNNLLAEDEVLIPKAVSGDGKIVVGIILKQPYDSFVNSFTWTPQTGLRIFQNENSSQKFMIYGLSYAGEFMVGQLIGSQLTHFPSVQRACIWTQATGLKMLGKGDGLNGAIESRATSVSANGNIVLGYALVRGSYRPFIWTAEDGMKALGDLKIDYVKGLMSADSLSAIGNAVIRQVNDQYTFIWARTGIRLTENPNPQGEWCRQAYVLNGSGKLIIEEDNEYLKHVSPFSYPSRWEKQGWVEQLCSDLLDAKGYIQSLSGDGKIAFGGATNPWSYSLEQSLCLWVQKEIIYLDKILKSFMPKGFNLLDATDISADGTIFIGTGYYSKDNAKMAWWAYIPRLDVFQSEGLNLSRMFQKKIGLADCLIS